MGFLDRILGRTAPIIASPSPAGIASAVLGGHETLEVVGESHYQEHLWRLAGGMQTERIRCAVQAVLVPEPDNPHDRNAICVLIDDGVVGYLSREDAVVYRPGLDLLMEKHGGYIALEGQIIGGGQRSGGLGMLGVFLDHDPTQFGLRARQISHIGELRTGLSQAVATDLDDDTYDLSWYDQLSGSRAPADIVTLRKLLVEERDPIDRHFMLSELGKCLYASRDAFASALDEFDAVCEQHHSEMHVIRAALTEKFGQVPIIEMYRQAAIRCQKARDWPSVRTWAERGLAVYGAEAARPEAVADLQKRLDHADAKIFAAAASGTQRARPPTAPDPAFPTEIEILTCSHCGEAFQRVRVRGRKPSHCPTCRGVSEETPFPTRPVEGPRSRDQGTPP
jgi:hypothetical protein